MTACCSNISTDLSWRSHPARERWRAALIASAAIIALALGAAIALGNFLWAAPAAAVLLLSLNRFFLPSSFTIDSHGIAARFPLRSQRFAWSELRRFVVDAHGGFLSRRARPSRFDAWQGMHIQFGPQQEAVIAAIRAAMNNRSAAE